MFLGSSGKHAVLPEGGIQKFLCQKGALFHIPVNRQLLEGDKPRSFTLVNGKCSKIYSTLLGNSRPSYD